MGDSLNLFSIGSKGVNTVAAPTHLDTSELISAQNAEVSPVQGEGGIAQRPGMTRINSTALETIVAVHDIPTSLMTDYVPTLFAGHYTGSTHNWRRSTNGTTWTNDDTPPKPFSANATLGFFVNFPKVCTIGRKMYYVDGSVPIRIYEYDGTTSTRLSTIPPAVSGTNLTTPTAPSVTYENDTSGATTYTYKVVAKSGSFSSIASAATSVTCKATLDSNNYNAFTDLGTPVSGATSYDVYRTAGGATQGKIGSIPISAGAFSTGNGSGLTKITFTNPGAPNCTITGASGWVPAGVTYTYSLVKVQGANHSALGGATTPTTIGPAAWEDGAAGHLPKVVINITATYDGVSSYDVYRTSGGPSTGLIGTIGVGLTTLDDTGQAGGAAPPGAASGLQLNPTSWAFSDSALVGDGTVAPVVASGVAAGEALAVTDMITDGDTLYLSVIDYASADPSVYGRVLAFSPQNTAWEQIGANFFTADGNGAPAALEFFDGTLSYGTYIGTASANTSYLKNLGVPLPAGGVQEVHTTAASQATCSMAVFNGDLYVGYVSLVAATAAVVVKRVAVATWSTSLTGVATAQYNAYTSLCSCGGKLYAGWTSGGGATAANIKSTSDGVTWSAEITLDAAEVPCQMVEFNDDLYVVVGRTGVAYNTKSRILKRATATGVWSAVDDPSDDFAGCLGIVYV